MNKEQGGPSWRKEHRRAVSGLSAALHLLRPKEIPEGIVHQKVVIFGRNRRMRASCGPTAEILLAGGLEGSGQFVLY